MDTNRRSFLGFLGLAIHGKPLGIPDKRAQLVNFRVGWQFV